MSEKIKKLLKVGDVVYSANGGKPMQVKKIGALGFETESDFFLCRLRGEGAVLYKKDALSSHTRYGKEGSKNKIRSEKKCQRINEQKRVMSLRSRA